MKIIILGSTEVGKTSIISQFTSKKFDPHRETSLSAQFISKTIELKDIKKFIKFEIWDTAGQEKFRSLARVFYNNASVCIMVYDMTNKKSFEELKNFWSEDVRNNISGSACKSKKYNLI